MGSLYTPHSPSLTVLHSDLERHAFAQRSAFLGTAGSVLERQNAGGFAYYVHQFYDGDRRKRDRYLAGPVGARAADDLAAAMVSRIKELKALVPSLRLLGREGFNLVDAKTYSILASLHNHGVFEAGGMLVGSHAYGVILNRLGIRAAAYRTEDVDIARRETLAFKVVPDVSFVEMLKQSGVDFVEVPQLDRRQPATSFKEPGKSRFQVDLLVPSRNETFPTVRIPELAAHATGLPYLAYLLAESQMAMTLAREGCCAIRVPWPERFAVHKLIVSQLRAGRDVKSQKDIAQAAVLCASLSELHPGAIESALEAVPARAGKYLRRALGSLRPLLEPHPRAMEEFGSAGYPVR